MKMVKLTLAPNGPALYVNPLHVVTVEPTGNSGTWTGVRLIENLTYTVKEPPEQVARMLDSAN